MQWDKIREEWEIGLKPAELEKKYGVKAGTIRSRASRESWTKNVATKKKSVAIVAVPKIVIENDGLTEKQKLFCIHYLKSFNATKAYQKVYGCDYNSAMASGSRLLGNVKVQEEIARLKRMLHSEAFLDSRAILQRWIDIAFADIGDYVTFGRKAYTDDNGYEREVNTVQLKESSELDTSLLTEIKEGREGVTIKMPDKIRALEMLTKYYDLLGESEKKRLEIEKLKTDIKAKEGSMW